MGQQAKPVAFASTSADATLYTPSSTVPGGGLLFGFSIRESAGTPAVATVILRDGTSAAGTILAEIELAANASQTVSFSTPVIFRTALYLDMVAGSAEGVVYVN